MVHLYCNQQLTVKWGDTHYPKCFTCTNCIKQGGVMSPILFCIYMDELLERLKKCNVGCFIGDTFLGAFSYVDDLTLVAPCISAAQKMLLVCEEYANEYNVLFNN